MSDKKSYCETCLNAKCQDKGVRNMHFSGNNHCSRYISKEDFDKYKEELDKYRKTIEEGLSKAIFPWIRYI